MPDGDSSSAKTFVYGRPSGGGAYEPSICSILSTATKPVRRWEQRHSKRTLDASTLYHLDISYTRYDPVVYSERDADAIACGSVFCTFRGIAGACLYSIPSLMIIGFFFISASCAPSVRSILMALSGGSVADVRNSDKTASCCDESSVARSAVNDQLWGLQLMPKQHLRVRDRGKPSTSPETRPLRQGQPTPLRTLAVSRTIPCTVYNHAPAVFFSPNLNPMCANWF